MCERENLAVVLLWQKVIKMVRAETAKSSLEADVNQATIKYDRKHVCAQNYSIQLNKLQTHSRNGG